MNTVHTGVFIYQTNFYDWITSTANSKSTYKEDVEHVIDKDSRSLIFDESSLDYDDKKDKLIFESQTFLYLHTDEFCEPALKHPNTNV